MGKTYLYGLLNPLQSGISWYLRYCGITLRFSDVFTGYRKAKPVCNGLIGLGLNNTFTLESQFTYFTYLILKKLTYDLQIFYILILFHWINHDSKLKTEEVPTQNPLELLFDRRKQALVGNLLIRFLLIQNDYHLRHNVRLRAKLCQMLSKCQRKVPLLSYRGS